ncbi:MAG TPA: TOBE domain-containing protein [Blastocatellia bacterium]|nr:TOBE domain-containing protein [Blastocatellia bacterium]
MKSSQLRQWFGNMGNSRDEDWRHGLTQARVSYRLPLTIEGDDADGNAFSLPAFVSNVTRRGAFVETAVPLAPGGLVALLRSEPERALLGFGQIVWVRTEPDDARGAGIKLAGDNTRWMDYLIAHSVQDIED